MDHKDAEVKMYGWPPGQRQRYVTKRVMFLKLSIYALSLGVAFSLGLLWSSFYDHVSIPISDKLNNGSPGETDHISSDMPPATQRSDEEEQNGGMVQQCCLRDIQTAEEALVRLSSGVQKFSMRANAKAKNKESGDLKTASLEVLAKQAQLLWDELENLRNNGRGNVRRIIRDITISLEELKEAFCHVPSSLSGALKTYMQVVDYRFHVMMIKLKMAPFLEGEVKLGQTNHNNGNSYFVHQDFGTPGDSMEFPRASKLHLYENGLEMGPGHSAHADIDQLGYGRWSHWKENLYFSASDNSNPLTNGREYTYRIYPNVPLSPEGIRICENESAVSGPQ